MNRRERSATWDRVMLAVASVVPALAGALHASNAPAATHDAEVLRAVGLGHDGPLRALDAWAAAPFLLWPVGTAAYRASLASVCAGGLAGGALFLVVRAVLARSGDAPRLGPAVAAVASTAVTLGVAWQLEMTAPGGAALGALLGVLPWLSLDGPRDAKALALRAAVPLALALAYEPWLGAAALSAWLAGWAVARFERRSAAGPASEVADARGPLWTNARVVAALVAAVAPPALTLAWRGRGALPAAPSGGAAASVDPVAFFHAQLGWLALALAVAGVALAAKNPRARAHAAAFVVAAAFGALAVDRGVAAGGPSRFASVALLALAAAGAAMAIAMQALVLAVSRARVPFAPASAAMVVVLEITFPVVNLDEASLRSAARARAAEFPWDEVMTADLPFGTLLVAHDDVVVRRLARARALGELRPDLSVLATRHLDAPASRAALVRSPELAALFRDVTLRGAPTEWALVSLADVRPVALLFDASWDPGLARHLIPAGAFDRFWSEPRGIVERRKALDAFAPTRAALVEAVAPEGAARDAALSQLTAAVLRARLDAFVAGRQRDLVARGLDDLRLFDPEAPAP